MALQRLTVSAGEYIRAHGQRAVSDAVRRWVSHPKSVRGCGDPVYGVQLLAIRVSSKGRTGLFPLRQCRNRFVDPYCSGWWRGRKASEIERVIECALDAGMEAMFVVHTMAHRRGDALDDLMRIHAQAWHGLRAGRAKAAWDPIAYIRFWDIIVGGKRGPHPHTNTVLIGPPGTFGPEWQAEQRLKWAQIISRKIVKAAVTGGTNLVNVGHAWSYGFLAQAVTHASAGRLSAYVSRHVEGIGYELVDDRHRGNRNDANLGGYTLLELACMAHAGQEQAGKLLARSSRQLVGKQSFSRNERWKDLEAQASVMSVSEDALAEAVHLDSRVIGHLPSSSYRRHRVAINVFMDSWDSKTATYAEVVQGWHLIDRDLDLGIEFFADPPSVEQYLGQRDGEQA